MRRHPALAALAVLLVLAGVWAVARHQLRFDAPSTTTGSSDERDVLRR